MAELRLNSLDISDAMIERPVSFMIGGCRYCLYYPTLGKLQLLSRLIGPLGFNSGAVANGDVYMIAKNAAKNRREETLRYLAYNSLPGDDCLHESKVLARIKSLGRADENDLPVLLITALTMDKTAAIMDELGVEKESKRLERVIKAKDKDKNSVSFGGKSIWGALIDAACERYGWTYQYVLWGISYCNLQMLLSDYVKTVFLTDDERKKIHVSTDNITINASDNNALSEFIGKQSWK